MRWSLCVCVTRRKNKIKFLCKGDDNGGYMVRWTVMMRTIMRSYAMGLLIIIHAMVEDPYCHAWRLQIENSSSSNNHHLCSAISIGFILSYTFLDRFTKVCKMCGDTQWYSYWGSHPYLHSNKIMLNFRRIRTETQNGLTQWDLLIPWAEKILKQDGEKSRKKERMELQ